MSEHRLDRIVIERPRWGERISSQKIIRKQVKQKLHQAKHNYQDLEIGSLKPCYKEKVRGIRSKRLSDHIQPLYRWLHSKVGQSWDVVYSELSQLLEFNTLSGQHILSHVWDCVERHVVIIDNIPYRKDSSYYSFRQRQLGQDWRGREQLYIHPKTKILCRAKIPSKAKPKPKEDSLWIDKYHQYYKLNDIWYFVSFRDVPPSSDVIDVLTGKKIDRKKVYYSRDPVYAYHKLQCNKKQIKWIKEQIKLKEY